MKRVTFYLIVFLVGLALVACAIVAGNGIAGGVPEGLRVPLLSVVAGGFGGVLYCLRGVYLNASAKGQWDNVWLPWYFLRPVASMLCGGVAWLFLSAGLLVLKAEVVRTDSHLGFYTLAFLAGLNVDKFVARIEEIAKSSFGIEKSRTTKEGEESPEGRR